MRWTSKPTRVSKLTVYIVNRDFISLWINNLSQPPTQYKVESEAEFKAEFYPALNQASVMFVPPSNWRDLSLNRLDEDYLRSAINELKRVIPGALGIAARQDSFELPQGVIAAAQDGYAGFDGRTVIDWVPVDRAPRNDLVTPRLVDYYNIEYGSKEHRLCHEVLRFDIKRIREPEIL